MKPWVLHVALVAHTCLGHRSLCDLLSPYPNRHPSTFTPCSKDEIGNETGAVMGELLSARADMLTINIAYNSLNTDFSRTNARTSRRALFPSFGRLYPEGAELLASVEDEDGLVGTGLCSNEGGRCTFAWYTDLFCWRDIRSM